MSKLKLFRTAENAVPTGAGNAGQIHFTDERNLYVISTAGSKVKFSDVHFVANHSALSALSPKLTNKIYVSLAETTMWYWAGSSWVQLNAQPQTTGGCTFYLEAGVPDDGNGQDGDLYFDLGSRIFYWKTSGVWEAFGKFYDDSDVYAAVKNEELLGDAAPLDPTDSLWMIVNKLFFIATDAQAVAQSKPDRSAEILTITGTTLTVSATAHVGKWLRFTNAAGCTIEMNASLPNGFQCMFYKDVSGGSIHFSGDATFITPAASIDDHYAIVHAIVIGGKVKFKGDYL